MPTYTYKCKDCDAEFVEKKSISDYDEIQACSNCNGLNVSQVIKSVPFAFSGYGSKPSKLKIDDDMNSRFKKLRDHSGKEGKSNLDRVIK